MSQVKTYKNCKHFGYQSCPHKNEDIMKKATQDIPEYYGGNYQILSYPTPEEINNICNKCDKFTQK